MNLKEFLSNFCEENAIEKCSTWKAVINYLKEKSKICMFNIDTLETCMSCKKIKFPVVNGPVRRYGKQLKKFHSDTSVKKLIDLVLNEVTSFDDVESLTLHLDDKRHNTLQSLNICTLQSLKHLMYHCFGVRSKAFMLFKIHKGCVSITWLVPTSLVSTLRETFDELHSPKISYLASLGVLSIVIGQQVIYNNEG